MALFGNRQSGYFGVLKGGGAIAGCPYGSFYDTTIQSAVAINTAYAMQLNSSDSPSNSGIVVINDAFSKPTCIQVSQTGIYNLQFSSQWQRSSGGTTETVDIWMRKNDSGATGNLANTNTHVSFQGNATYLVTAWNFFLNLNANDYVQVMWSTTSTAIQLYYDVPNGVHPATPSVILTMNRVS